MKEKGSAGRSALYLTKINLFTKETKESLREVKGVTFMEMWVGRLPGKTQASANDGNVWDTFQSLWLFVRT